MMDPGRSCLRPILYWDGDCDFCRRWVDRWAHTTDGSVDFQTLQEAPSPIQAAAGGLPFQRIVLVQADGTLVTGAEAALSALAGKDRDAARAYSLYRRLPWVGPAMERGYAWVARHRELGGQLTRLFWGHTTRVPSYQVSGDLFPRLIGLIFLFAFISLWTQIHGLAGSQGILPVAEHLEEVKAHGSVDGSSWKSLVLIPSLLWLGSGDAMLHFWLGLGAFASTLLLFGCFPAPAALVAWACYLSFAAAVPVFLNFQWDGLLLETGFLLIFYVPWSCRLRRGCSAPSRMGRLLIWWLLFRIIFESGVVKLYGFDTTGTNAWLEGTALSYHYFTQPIPVWTSWWLAIFPQWFHLVSLVGLFTVELVLPFFIAGPRRLRIIAFSGISGLMILIMASGNYGFFNLLVLALALSLVDDSWWPSRVRRWWEGTRTSHRHAVAGANRIRNRILPWLAAVLIIITGLQLLAVLRLGPPKWVGSVIDPVMAWRSTNSYGLFRVMTTERPELTIESSSDGVRWYPYRFTYKVDGERNALPFFLPHMPRLDWQMWFAALEFRNSGRLPGWFSPFLQRLGEKSPSVLSLLEVAPHPHRTTRAFRIRLDLLTFAPPPLRKETGQVWQVTPLPRYTVQVDGLPRD